VTSVHRSAAAPTPQRPRTPIPARPVRRPRHRRRPPRCGPPPRSPSASSRWSSALRPSPRCAGAGSTTTCGTCSAGCWRAGRGGLPASGTFVHRPLAYRWLVSWLDHLTTGPVAVREAWIRLLVIIVTAAVVWWLRSGLARHLPRRGGRRRRRGRRARAALRARLDFLQPDWLAVLLAVAGLAAALAPRRTWIAVTVAGVLIALVGAGQVQRPRPPRCCRWARCWSWTGGAGC